MREQLRELWDRIRRFEFDDATAARPFTAKLAGENGWSHELALRAVEEYRRFVLLAIAAGHPVCPSDEVDGVWHLHLTFTESYWGRFCPYVLGRPLHHHPSRGGPGELARHVAMYEATLASYRRIFGQEPPRDLWPPTRERFARKPQLRVGSGALAGALRSIVALGTLTVTLIAGPVALAGGLAAASTDGPLSGLNPFDLPGPQFLRFYFGAALAGLILAGLLRWSMRKPADELADDPGLDSMELACLRGGADGAVDAAIATLGYRKVIEPVVGKRAVRIAGELPEDAHPLERAIVANLPPGTEQKVESIRSTMGHVAGRCGQRLEALGLVAERSQSARAVFVPLMAALVAPAMGAVKVAIGMSRNRPVEILLVLVVVSLVLAAIVCLRPARRTRRGDRLLEQYGARFARLRKGWNIPAGSDGRPAGDLALATGLFGVGILAGGPWAELHQTLSVSDHSGGGDAGGCGGGGCGGGCGGCGCG